MEVSALAWIVLGGIIVAMIAVDLVGHVRKPHAPTLKEATWWSLGYIAMAVVFGLIVWAGWGSGYAGEYFAGYVTEKSLSVDNLFVFVLIMAAFEVPRAYQQRVLLWGILIALVMRGAFIAVGAAIITEFAWVFYLFGAFLIYTATPRPSRAWSGPRTTGRRVPRERPRPRDPPGLPRRPTGSRRQR